MTTSPHPDAAVRPDALADHAARLTAAVAALDPADLGHAARGIAAATSGSHAAAAADALALRWESAVRAWVADARHHAAALADSARDYADNDHDLATTMRSIR